METMNKQTASITQKAARMSVTLVSMTCS